MDCVGSVFVVFDENGLFFMGHNSDRQSTPQLLNYRDSKVQGANMWPIWGRQGPGGPHVGPMNFATWVAVLSLVYNFEKLIPTKI